MQNHKKALTILVPASELRALETTDEGGRVADDVEAEETKDEDEPACQSKKEILGLLLDR